MVDSNNRIADAVARLKSATGHATATAEKTEETHRTKVVATPAAERKEDAAYDIKANPVYKIMTDTAKSNRQKIEGVVKYMTAQNDDYDAASKHELEFAMYFANEQAERVKIDKESIQKLITELESATNAEVSRIVDNITKVQTASDRIGQLLDAMRQARIDGTSIAQISEAMKFNDQLIKEIAKLEVNLAHLKSDELKANTSYNDQLDRKIASHQGFGNKMARMWGEDKEIATAISFAQTELAAAKASVQRNAEQLAEKNKQRDVNLETGKFVILRGIDATEQGLTQEIATTAKGALLLLDSMSDATANILAKNKLSQDAAVDIRKQIDAAKVREMILASAIQEALTATQAQSVAIKTKLDSIDAEVESLGADSVDGALKSVERTEMAQQHTGALGHEEALGKVKNNFISLKATSAAADTEAKQFAAFVRGHFDYFSNIQTMVIPATAQALHVGLRSNYAMGVGEIGQIIDASARAAQQITSKNLHGLSSAQQEMRTAELKRIDDMCKQVNDAQKVVADTIDSIVAFGIDSAQKQGNLGTATKSLQQATAAFNEVGALIADRSATAKNNPVADEPVRGGAGVPKGAVLALVA